NHSIADIISLKYLLYLQDNSDGKFNVEFIISRAPPAWKGYVGTIDDNLLYHWISTNYDIQQPPEIPERPNIMKFQSNQPPLSPIITNPEELYNVNSFNQSNDHIITMSPTSVDQVESPLSRSPTRSPILELKSPIYSPTNAMVILNERHEYMKHLANDNSRQLRVIVCGPPDMMESVRLSLNKIGFPDEKAIFIV
ncbi:15445_t:CDS:1, partial [Cetraspora pellucida]